MQKYLFFSILTLILHAHVVAADTWFSNAQQPDCRLAVIVADRMSVDHYAPVCLTSETLLAIAPSCNPTSLMVVDPARKPAEGPAPVSGGALLPSAVQWTSPTAWVVDFQVPLKANETKTVYLYWHSDRAAPASFVRKSHAMHGAEAENWNRFPGIETDRLTLETTGTSINVWSKSTPEMALALVTGHNNRLPLGDRHLFTRADMGLGGFIVTTPKVTLALQDAWAHKGPAVSRLMLTWSSRPAPQGYQSTWPQRLLDPLLPKVTAVAPARKPEPTPFLVTQEFTACAGDPFILQTLTVMPADEQPWKLQLGMTALKDATPVTAPGWLAQWKPAKATNPKAAENDPGIGLAVKLLRGEGVKEYTAGAVRGWELAGIGKRSYTFLLAGAGAAAADDASTAEQFAADLAAVEQVLAVRNRLDVRLGALETRRRPALQALTTAKAVVLNSASARSLMPVQVELEDYGYSVKPGQGVQVEAGGNTIAADVWESVPGRHTVVFPLNVPPMRAQTVTLRDGNSKVVPGFVAIPGVGRLIIQRTDKQSWIFDASGLREVRLPDGNMLTTGELAPAEEGAPRVAFLGRHICVVDVGQGNALRRYWLYQQSPFWRVEHPAEYSAEIKADLWVAKWDNMWGAYPSGCAEWRGTADLFGVHDWIAYGTPAAQLWAAPSSAMPRMAFGKDYPPATVQEARQARRPLTDDDIRVSWRRQAPAGDELCITGPYYRQEYVGRNNLSPYSARRINMWHDPMLYHQRQRGITLFAAMLDPDEGRKLVVARSELKLMMPLRPDTYVYRADLTGDGCPESFYCHDANANGPDLIADRWYIDTDSDGSYQSIFQFTPATPATRAVQCEIYLDNEGFFYDGVIDLASDEGRIAPIVLHDQTQDGIFVTGDVFYGGMNDRDRFQQRFGQQVTYQQSLAAAMEEERKAIEQYGMPHMYTALDIDGDGDWDLNWEGIWPVAYGPNINYADIGVINGPVYNPLSGAYFATAGPHYQCPAAVMTWCSRIYQDENGAWKQPHWFDNPQSDLNLDGDPAPEVHVMSPAAVMGTEHHGYLSNRMVYDMDNDNGGRPNTPFPPGNHGRSFDLHLAPKVFLTSHEGIRRCPQYPPEPGVFKDPHGNMYDTMGQYIAHDWDGKAYPALDKHGKSTERVSAWDWSLQAKWDCVAAVWSPNGDLNPEAMQIFEPNERPWLRYDQQIGSMTDWHIYRSPLTGFNHLRGAQWGWRIGMRDDVAVNQWRKDCYWALGFDFAQWIHDVDFARAVSAPHEAYFDQANTGVFDTALCDFDNDGRWDRRVWYDARAGMIALAEEAGLACIPAQVTCPSENVRLENYPQLVKLYTETLAQRYESWLDRSLTPAPTGEAQQTSPILAPRRAEPIKDFHVVLPAASLPRVALDVMHSPKTTAQLLKPGDRGQHRSPAARSWSDHMLNGYSRLFTAFGRHQVRCDSLTTPWTREALADVDLLVLPGMDAGKPFTTAEVSALHDWLMQGGTLLVAYPAQDAAACLHLNALLARYHIALSAERVHADLSNDLYVYHMGSMKSPSQDWLVDKLGCMKDVAKLWYHAGVFTEWAEPILTAHGKPLAVRTTVGEGAIYAFASEEFLNNRYTAHCDNSAHQYFLEMSGTISRQGMTPILVQPDNNRYLDQVVDHLSKRFKPDLIVSSTKNGLSVQGAGTMWIPAEQEQVRVNGKAVTSMPIEGMPAYRAIVLPQGKHTISAL
jgi:hypothetical protein